MDATFITFDILYHVGSIFVTNRDVKVNFGYFFQRAISNLILMKTIRYFHDFE